MTHFLTHHGLPLLFLAVMIESFGIPVPGETALIAFGVLASQGRYSIGSVIVLAAAGGIVGDNLGYWLIGRRGGRALLARWSWLERRTQRPLRVAENLMRRYGGLAVLIGRFVAILRFTIAWIAGLTRMPWWRFLFWNAAGAVVWATTVGLGAYYGGRAAASAVRQYGSLAIVGIVGVVVIGLVAGRVARRRLERGVAPKDDGEGAASDGPAGRID